jgi:hypothetical protein
MIQKHRISNRSQKLISRQVYMAEKAPPPTTEYLNWSGQPIGFTIEDHPPQVPRPGHSAIILPAVIEGYDVSRIFIDGGSSLNLIYVDTLRKMNISRLTWHQRTRVFTASHPKNQIIPWERSHLMCNLEQEKISERRSWSLNSLTDHRNIMPSWDDPHMLGLCLYRTTHICYRGSPDLRAQ